MSWHFAHDFFYVIFLFAIILVACECAFNVAICKTNRIHLIVSVCFVFAFLTHSLRFDLVFKYAYSTRYIRMTRCMLYYGFVLLFLLCLLFIFRFYILLLAFAFFYERALCDLFVAVGVWNRIAVIFLFLSCGCHATLVLRLVYFIFVKITMRACGCMQWTLPVFFSLSYIFACIVWKWLYLPIIIMLAMRCNHVAFYDSFQQLKLQLLSMNY